MIRQKEQIEKDVTALEAQNKMLLAEIGERRKILLEMDAEKKAIEDFLAEIKKYGLDICLDSLGKKRFLATLQVFRRFNFDCNTMVNSFIEIQDIAAEKRDLKQQKQEIKKQWEILDRRLEEIGFGNFEQLRSTITALMTFERFGITQDMIIKLCNQGPQTSRRAYECDAQYINQRNNGGGGQNHYNNNYGYNY
jgi:hypothetical protein